jgi:hypothetical protein
LDWASAHTEPKIIARHIKPKAAKALFFMMDILNPELAQESRFEQIRGGNERLPQRSPTAQV